MSNSIRFEFYNNFDIWYDLYQENGGDPGFFINILMYSLKIEYLYGNAEGFGNGYGDEFGDGDGDWGNNIFGDGNEDGFGYGIGYVTGTFYEHGSGAW